MDLHGTGFIALVVDSLLESVLNNRVSRGSDRGGKLLTNAGGGLVIEGLEGLLH